MGIEDSLDGIARARIDIERANEQAKMLLMGLEGYFAGSIDAFNADAGNEFIITDWNASVTSGTSKIIINVECLKDRETNYWLDEESCSPEHFVSTEEELKRIIKQKTNQDVEVSFNTSYYGK